MTVCPVPRAKEAVVNTKCSILKERPLCCGETKMKKELEKEKALEEKEEGERGREGKRRLRRKKKRKRYRRKRKKRKSGSFK